MKIPVCVTKIFFQALGLKNRDQLMFFEDIKLITRFVVAKYEYISMMIKVNATVSPWCCNTYQVQCKMKKINSRKKKLTVRKPASK
jgi:hypothetical protein